ncbi:MAG: DJ-1/PfpI family protein [Candidatus Pacebacteria bacterium]|nr:DJ-1/PfpI family protein [Candidatus Paceibacterota bacterium]
MSINKKIVLIIAFKDFRDEEYFIPIQSFNSAGFETVTASTSLGTAFGAYGGEANVDTLIEDLDAKKFDAIVFVGGGGSIKHLNDPQFHTVAKKAIEYNKILGAICFAPAILAKAGVLSGRKATVWSSPMDRSTIKILQENGVEYINNNVVADGNIITANGPDAAEKFSKEIINKLKQI